MQQLSDDTFVMQFEAKSLAPEAFTHIGHLRLAWLYLNQYPLHSAIDKATTGINAYATSLGATDKFHHTITEALLRIIKLRITQWSYASFDEFSELNIDLVDDVMEVLHGYYSEKYLNSSTAKIIFVQPDKRGFNRV